MSERRGCQRCGERKPAGYDWSVQYAYKLTGTVCYVMCKPCIQWSTSHPLERLAEAQP